MKSGAIWSISGAISLILLVFLFGLWVNKNRQILDPTQLPDDLAVQEYLQSNWPEPSVLIKTGIYIQSLKFVGTSDVHLTGYIWQKFQDGLHDSVKPEPGEIGFVLPETVDAGSGVVREAYRVRQEDEEVVGWYFEQTLRQSFDYADYPFDHKTVWVRLWPRDFSGNIVLTPDFASYDSTGPNDVFGIDEMIVLGTWQRENTFFDYKTANYDTNFGIRDYAGQEGFPELHYNVLIKRKFSNAFIVHMVPLFVVSTLMFGAVMTVTRQPELSQRHGTSTANVLGTCSVLFLVVLLAHVQLREVFSGSRIVYMEKFFFMMYVMLLVVSVNTYLFAHAETPSLRVIHYKDNLIPKAAFWPVVLFLMVVITLFS